MMKILFPTDFSDTANNAFIYALNLAKATSAEIYVLNCYEMPVISSTSSGKPELVQEVYNSIELNHFDHFKEQVPYMRKIAETHNSTNVKLTFLFEEGVLLSILKRTISKEEIDYIVMGTNGANTLEKKLLGSTTVSVINHINLPILCVPKEAKFHSLDHIGFATQLKETDKKGIETIAKISEKLNTTFKCLHVLKDEKQEYETTLNKWAEEFAPKGITFHTILNKDIEQSVLFFIYEYDIDVMCIVKRQLNFFEKFFTSSLSEKLAYNSYIPVLILREEKEN